MEDCKFTNVVYGADESLHIFDCYQDAKVLASSTAIHNVFLNYDNVLFPVKWCGMIVEYENRNEMSDMLFNCRIATSEEAKEEILYSNVEKSQARQLGLKR